VTIAPNVASFRDTLARARLRAGDREGALDQFVRALELDPVSLEALIGKATALASLGRHDQVRELLRTIDLMLKGRPPLPADLKRELDATRASANAA
jgi:Flp pilus assembly protein TadD